ncbi:MAG: hypothetical protein QNJ44_09855 [Rhodobacter sp.]|nr:hypothetical protein [Rhodobacter sp.]
MSGGPAERFERALQLAGIAHRAALAVGTAPDPEDRRAAQSRFEEASQKLVTELAVLTDHGVTSEISLYLSRTYGGRA